AREDALARCDDTKLPVAACQGEMCRDDLHPIPRLAINAAVGQGVAADARALANLEGEIALHLEEVRGDDADREDHQSQMDEVASVALAMPANEHGEGAGVGFAVTVADAHATPELSENGGGGERADGKGNVGPEIRHGEEWQDEGAERGGQRWP